MSSATETDWPGSGCEQYGHSFRGHHPCGSCGAPYVELTEIEKRIAAAVKWDLIDQAGRDEHAEEVGRKVAKALGLTREQRTLADGEGGVTYNHKTGEVRHTGKPCTIQQRWVTRWK